MNAFNIEFPSICLRALLKGYNTCGVENQDAHYSGMLDVRVDGCVDQEGMMEGMMMLMMMIMI